MADTSLTKGDKVRLKSQLPGPVTDHRATGTVQAVEVHEDKNVETQIRVKLDEQHNGASVFTFAASALDKA